MFLLTSVLIVIIFSFNSTTAFAFVDNVNSLTETKYKEILIIASQSDDTLWESKVLSELTKELNSSPLNMHIQKEILGQYHSDSNYLEKQAELLSLKYTDINFDLIITLDDESLDFVGKYYSARFLKDVPVIYGGTNDVSKLSQYPYNKFTGVNEFLNVNSLIGSILKIIPETKEINVVLDNSLGSKAIENQFRDWIPYYHNIVKFNFIRSDYLTEVCTSLDKHNTEAPMIVIGNFRDSSRILFNPQDTINILNHYTNSIYTINESYINSGVIGGSILYAETHGHLIYDMVYRVLNGESTLDIPNIYDSSNVFVFNAIELHENAISRNSLPENSIIINDSWLYKGVSVLIVISLCIFLIVVVALLVAQTFSKKKNEMKIVATKKKYNEILLNDKIKTEFLANFSHEIRTLLNVMLSGLQLLDIYKETGRVTFKNKDDEIKLGYIRQNGYRLLKLINNLIDMTKIDSGFYNVEFEVNNIVEVIEDITMSVVEYAKNKGITIIFDTDEEEMYMPLDAEKLDRIILNLLSNAIKFTPPGGFIYVTLSCSKDKISVSIKDTGIGIPKDKQDKLFTRFAQVKNSHGQNKEGSGIGLSLVSSLIALLDGTIILKSEENKGCEFIFTLPVKDFDKATEEVQRHISQSISSNAERIMVELSDIDKGLDM